MKILGYLILCTLITSCSTVVPVTVPFPEAPNVLIDHECEKLSLLEQGAQLSNVVSHHVETITKYYECRRISQGWQTWYLEQREIYNNATNR